jgi:hypothetical protein
MDVDQRIDAVEKDLARLWCLVGVLAVACLILGADAWIQGDLIRRSSSQQHHEEAPLCLTRKKTNHMKTLTHTTPPVALDRLVRLAGYRVTVNGSPAEIINNTVRWHRAIGYFEFAEDHGGKWSKDGLEWRIDGKTIKFSEPNVNVDAPAHD